MVTKLMTSKLAYTQIPASHVSPSIYSIPKVIRIHKAFATTYSSTKNNGFARPIWKTRVGKQGSGVVGEDKKFNQKVSEDRTIPEIKAELCHAIQSINRGIFGVPSEKKAEIEGLVKLLEFQNPCPEPTLNLDKLDGCWKLVYSTITILGPKRTKLGLRDFITLGDFFQTIDVTEGKAVNEIKFSARGLNLLNGQLTIEASFDVATESRVNISYDKSTITPDQLMHMFRKNYDLLLSIFNPEGWLEITYLDDDMRIGRDDKGNIFILEKSVADRQ